jgi:hypothetical protein
MPPRPKKGSKDDDTTIVIDVMNGDDPQKAKKPKPRKKKPSAGDAPPPPPPLKRTTSSPKTNGKKNGKKKPPPITMDVGAKDEARAVRACQRIIALGPVHKSHSLGASRDRCIMHPTHWLICAQVSTRGLPRDVVALRVRVKAGIGVRQREPPRHEEGEGLCGNQRLKLHAIEQTRGAPEI